MQETKNSFHTYKYAMQINSMASSCLKKREQQRIYTFCLQGESQEIASDIILSQQTQSTYSSIILLGANVWILHHL